MVELCRALFCAPLNQKQQLQDEHMNISPHVTIVPPGYMFHTENGNNHYHCQICLLPQRLLHVLKPMFIADHFPCSISIQRIASESLIFPRYTCVVFKSWCLNSTLDMISKGTPFRLAYVAECRRKS